MLWHLPCSVVLVQISKIFEPVEIDRIEEGAEGTRLFSEDRVEGAHRHDADSVVVREASTGCGSVQTSCNGTSKDIAPYVLVFLVALHIRAHRVV